MTEVLTPTRERLLRAARELIEEGGYGAATVVAIAERAGVASGTLYRHFASKEELFVELFRAVCDREVQAMREVADAMPADAAHVDRLETVLATFAARALRRPRLAWALIAEPVDPLVDAERIAYRARYSALTAETLRAGIEAGELPEQNVAARRSSGPCRRCPAPLRRPTRSSRRCGRSCAVRWERAHDERERAGPDRAGWAGVHRAAVTT
jgi:AcrR family transcriptional regulator